MRNAMLFDPRVLVHKRFTDKMPANWVLAGLIAMALPHAKILWLVRDPIDNLISAWREPMAGHGWAASFDGLASRWRAMNRSLEVAVHTLPDWMLKVVRYEDLVVDAENTMRGILEHLELPWNAGVLSPETVERRITTASLLQARQPITTQSIGWWSRIYEKPLEPLRARLVDPRQDAAA